MKMKKLLRAAVIVGAAMMGTSVSASPIVYTGTQQVGTIAANYSITTDGLSGQLNQFDIQSFSVSLNNGSNIFDFDSNSGYAVGGFVATPLTLSLSNGATLTFLKNSSAAVFGELNFTPSETLARTGNSSDASLALNAFLFATANTAPTPAVPEPATWLMMIVGMGAVGYAMRSAERRSDEKFDAKIKRITYGIA